MHTTFQQLQLDQWATGTWLIDVGTCGWDVDIHLISYGIRQLGSSPSNVTKQAKTRVEECYVSMKFLAHIILNKHKLIKIWSSHTSYPLPNTINNLDHLLFGHHEPLITSFTKYIIYDYFITWFEIRMGCAIWCWIWVLSD